VELVKYRKLQQQDVDVIFSWPTTCEKSQDKIQIHPAQ